MTLPYFFKDRVEFAIYFFETASVPFRNTIELITAGEEPQFMDDCPANLDLIEQVVLVRNRGQHPGRITSLFTHHTESDLEKFPSPYFVLA